MKAADFDVVATARRAAQSRFSHYHQVMERSANSNTLAQGSKGKAGTPAKSGEHPKPHKK